MTKFGIIKLSLNAALNACANGGRVYLLDLDCFEKVREIRYMPIAEIVVLEKDHEVIFFEVVPEEIYDR